MPTEAEPTESSAINARLEGAKASQAQIRFTLGMMAFISMMMLIASYNAYLSYDYRWILESNERQMLAEKARAERIEAAAKEGPAHKLAIEKEEADRQKLASVGVSDKLTEQALKDWASSRIVLISLLGIRVSVDDASVLGTAVLLILSVWLLLWAREENHTIGSLLRETAKEGPDDKRDPPAKPSKRRPDSYSSRQRWLIFHTINSNSIFLMVYPSFYRVDSLRGALQEASVGFKGWVNHVGFGFFRNFFSLFPVIAALIVFGIDRLSYFIQDPFHPYFERPGVGYFFLTSTVVFFLFWLPLLFCCWRSRGYSKDTERVLRQYEAELEADSSEQGHPPQS
jgi:uncharacterized membrane protein YqjE